MQIELKISGDASAAQIQALLSAFGGPAIVHLQEVKSAGPAPQDSEDDEPAKPSKSEKPAKTRKPRGPKVAVEEEPEDEEPETDEEEDDEPAKKPAKGPAKSSVTPNKWDDDEEDEDEPEEAKVTVEDCRALLKTLPEAKHPKATAILAKYGASSLSKLSAENLPKVYEAIKKLKAAE